MSNAAQQQEVMVVVDVQVDRKRPEITIVRQAIAVKDGAIVLVGTKREERHQIPRGGLT